VWFTLNEIDLVRIERPYRTPSGAARHFLPLPDWQTTKHRVTLQQSNKLSFELFLAGAGRDMSSVRPIQHRG
jgi:hypothetical protein